MHNESNDSSARTSKTLLRSPLSNSSIPGNVENASGKKRFSLKIKEVKHSINVNYEHDVDAWYKNKELFEKKGGFFFVGRTSEVLKGIGVMEQNVIWDKSKIKKILKDHPEITIDIIKKYQR